MQFRGKILLMLLLTMTAAATTFAQLGMELKSNQKTYMIHEPVFLQIGIRNDSGQPLVFGDQDNLRGRLFLEMTDSLELNSTLSQGTKTVAEFPLYGCVIRPGEMRRLVLRFDSILSIRKAGFYRIHAYIKHPMLKDAFRSNEVRIELTWGAILRRYPVGVPKLVQEKDKTIESRTYTLRTSVDGGSKYYYVMLEDDKRIYQVVRIGADLGIETPRTETDSLSRLHVLVNISAKVFKYYVIDISGKIESCEYFKPLKTSPTLIREPGGRVYVTGGAPAIEGEDYVMESSTIQAVGD